MERETSDQWENNIILRKEFVVMQSKENMSLKAIAWFLHGKYS